MNFVANTPYVKCWVRKEYTHNHEKYHGEFLHAMAIAVTTIPNRCLSFQVVFTGIDEEENIEKIIELNENFTIKKNDNNYEQKDYERAIKNNMAQALVNKIIFHLSKY